MEYFAKIIKTERSKNKQFWRYTFLDLKTNETDCFINNYSLKYISGLPGKLKLAWDKSNKYKIYQDFNQDLQELSNQKGFEEEEWIDWWEEDLDKENQGLVGLFTKRPIKHEHQDYVDFINILHYKLLVPWKEIAAAEKRTDRALRYRREKITKSFQKVGRKRIMDRKAIFHLIRSIQTEEAKTLKEMANYVAKNTDKKPSKSTIHLTLERIGYSYQAIHYRNPQQKQNLTEVIDFIEEVNKLPQQHLILSTDESGFPLNLARKKAWGIKGKKITRFKTHYATNYTLLLMIRNTDRGGIIHWELFKGAVNTEIFANFINNVKLPTNEKYYLLLDKLKVHEAKKVEKALKNKNIESRFIVAANPWSNPIEEVFHVIKKYVESQEPRTYEKLWDVVNKIINEINQQGLTKYFKDCLDFDFVYKSESGN